MCIRDRVVASTRLRLSFDPGQPLPLLRGASVRLLLGSLSPAERRSYIEAALSEGAQLPVDDTEQYLGEIERDVERGWAISNEEIDQGVWAASGAVYEDGRIVAALSAPCAAFRLDDERRAVIIEEVRKAATDLSNSVSPS